MRWRQHLLLSFGELPFFDVCDYVENKSRCFIGVLNSHSFHNPSKIANFCDF